MIIIIVQHESKSESKGHYICMGCYILWVGVILINIWVVIFCYYSAPTGIYLSLSSLSMSSATGSNLPKRNVLPDVNLPQSSKLAKPENDTYFPNSILGKSTTTKEKLFLS